MKTIGLTGGIGSGKSSATEILAEFGAAVINADSVGHDIYRPGTDGWKKVSDAFGSGIVAADGSIDRKKLGAIVFADPAALKRLNAIVHPLISDEVKRRIAALRASGFRLPIVVEAAILIEANWQPLVDEVWLLVAGKAAVVQRLRAQRGVTTADIEARIAAQLDDPTRRRQADVVIENDASLDSLRHKLHDAWMQLLKRDSVGD
ncbi:MAG: dephospho-CoA kinase [Deltaproteobacteria bacterium]|nr:dephospho-CoA kinase [Deltaproteobacteria bacterium]